MTYRKPFLPEKVCPMCGRPFRWRKKWRHTWERVIYCSKACAERKRPKTSFPATTHP
ncbi:MAG: DUF2256 domain-containing protein [Acidobacteriota bacterium]